MIITATIPCLLFTFILLQLAVKIQSFRRHNFLEVYKEKQLSFFSQGVRLEVSEGKYLNSTLLTGMKRRGNIAPRPFSSGSLS